MVTKCFSCNEKAFENYLENYYDRQSSYHSGDDSSSYYEEN